MTLIYLALGFISFHLMYIHLKLRKLHNALLSTKILKDEEEEPLDSTPVSSFYKSHREGK